MEKITKKYYLKLINDFNNLYHRKLPQIRKNIEEYRKHGDFSENAELKSEIQTKQRIEEQLAKISKIMHSSEIIDASDLQNSNTIQFGTKLELTDTKNNKEVYQIVSIYEANLEENKIYYKAPLAQKLIGKKLEETITINDETYVITKIYIL